MKRTLGIIVKSLLFIALVGVLTFGVLTVSHKNPSTPPAPSEGETKTPPTLTEIREQTQTVTTQESKDDVIENIQSAQEQAKEDKNSELEAQLQMERDFAENTPVDPGSTDKTYAPPAPEVH